MFTHQIQEDLQNLHILTLKLPTFERYNIITYNNIIRGNNIITTIIITISTNKYNSEEYLVPKSLVTKILK